MKEKPNNGNNQDTFTIYNSSYSKYSNTESLYYKIGKKVNQKLPKDIHLYIIYRLQQFEGYDFIANSHLYAIFYNKTLN